MGMYRLQPEPACSRGCVGLGALTMLQLIDFGFSFALFYATSKGLGLHAHDIPPADEPALNRANYAFTVLYVRYCWYNT